VVTCRNFLAFVFAGFKEIPVSFKSVNKSFINHHGLVPEKGAEKGKSGSKEVDETPSCSVAVSFAKLYAGVNDFHLVDVS